MITNRQEAEALVGTELELMTHQNVFVKDRLVGVDKRDEDIFLWFSDGTRIGLKEIHSFGSIQPQEEKEEVFASISDEEFESMLDTYISGVFALQRYEGWSLDDAIADVTLSVSLTESQNERLSAAVHAYLLAQSPPDEPSEDVLAAWRSDEEAPARVIHVDTSKLEPIPSSTAPTMPIKSKSPPHRPTKRTPPSPKK